MRWKRVGLQPQINFDFFKTIYKRYEPEYATWHTGHCAHYMHHYWRAWDDSQFKVKATPEEKKHFGSAVEYGYQLADELLGASSTSWMTTRWSRWRAGSGCSLMWWTCIRRGRSSCG
ncbi:MAG: hypothetical protein R3B70_44950 [Polyangiaceae bacterium]